jgi:ankyrin repeat protein
VKVLLEKRAEVNAQRGYYGNALQAASLNGHEGIMKMLLEKGAKVNAQGGAYGNALRAATYNGHEGHQENVKSLNCT